MNHKFVFIIGVLISAACLFGSREKTTEMVPVEDATEKYIAAYDVHQRELEGCDYEKCKSYIPDAKTGIRVAEELREELKNIDRKRALAGIYRKLCSSQEMNKDTHVKLLKHLQMISYHQHEDYDSVTWSDAEGEMVVDPLLLLESHSMQCGQVNRLACDFADAIGIKARLCQLGGHVIAELYYDGSWHYFDADYLSYGNYAEIDGNIPSLEDLSKDCYLIDFFGYG